MFKAKVPRFGLVGLALILAVSLLVGCAGPAPTPTAAPAPTKAPSAPAPEKPAASAPAAQKPAAAAPAAAPKPADSAAKPADKPAAAAPAKPTGAPVKVGYMTALTGRLAANGLQQKVAVDLAVEDINAAGGINGKPFELVVFDSPFNPQEAVAGVRRLAEQDKVFAILGPFSSAEVETVSPIAKQLEIPLTTASATKPGIVTGGRPWSFRHSVMDELTLPVSVSAFKKVYPNAKKLVIVGDVKEAVNETIIRTLLPKVLKDQGYEVMDTLGFETGTTDFSALVTRIKGLKADGVAFSAIFPEAVGFAKEAERQELKLPVLTGASITAVPFLGTVGKAADGWVEPRQASVENPDPDFQKFLPRFNAKAKASNINIDQLSLEVSAYDVLQWYADIMRKNNIAADTDLKKARTTIRDGLIGAKNPKSLYGAVTMTDRGETEWQAYPHVAKDGKWQLIK